MRSGIFIKLWLLSYTAFPQKRSGVEQYYYGGNQRVSVVVPKAYFQNKKNWYGEIRYNYEELQTVSLNAGKIFLIEQQVRYTITPIAGLMAGRINGGSLGVNLGAEYKKLFFSAESQYTVSAEKRADNYFYNWSELGYQVNAGMYTGVAIQLTHLYKTNSAWEPGVMAGFSLGNFTFPLYIFNPASKSKYFVLGINIEWGKD